MDVFYNLVGGFARLAAGSAAVILQLLDILLLAPTFDEIGLRTLNNFSEMFLEVNHFLSQKKL